MRARLKQLQHIFTLEFNKVKLSWLLAAINILLILALLGAISVTAVRSLRSLADSQGVVRVQLAGTTAREELRKTAEDLLTATRSLATRSTLRRLVSEGSSGTLTPFLRRACDSAGADLCGVWVGDQVVAQTKPGIPWPEALTAAREQGERFMFVGMDSAPMLGAMAYVDDSGTTTRVFALKVLDSKMAARLSERVGLAVRFVNFGSLGEQPGDELTQLHSAAVSDGRSATARIGALDVFASSFPVFASTGETVALIETRLPTQELDEHVSSLERRLVLTAIVLGAAALLAAVWLARFVTQPVRALTTAAGRLGQGDFSTSIPMTGAAEVGVLARTMEDMRRSLVDLTGALRQREAEAQAVLNGVVEGVFAVDKQRQITYLNAQAAKMLGVHAQDAVGQFCGDVLKPCAQNGERPCEHNCPILQARAGLPSRIVEPLQGADGMPKSTVITSAVPVDGLQVQVIRDETELEAVRRARDSVLANISHEFRTPLAAQLASIELLRDGLESMSAPQRRELVMSLERGTHRLTRLIDNLLESVRIEAGQLGIRHQPVVLAEIIDDARELLGSLFEQRKQSLQIDLPDLPTFDGDAARLTQVFVNLLANANKYAPEHSVVRIAAQVSESNILAWVEDEGPGVVETTPGAVFERFSRGRAEEPEPGGLGLGLWIVKSIMERHGGSVRVERTAEQRTRFIVALPLAHTAEPALP